MGGRLGRAPGSHPQRPGRAPRAERGGQHLPSARRYSSKFSLASIFQYPVKSTGISGGDWGRTGTERAGADLGSRSDPGGGRPGNVRPRGAGARGAATAGLQARTKPAGGSTVAVAPPPSAGRGRGCPRARLYPARRRLGQTFSFLP